MPKRRYIKLPSGDTVPIIENGKTRPEFPKDIESRTSEQAQEITVPEMPDNIVGNQGNQPELIPSEDDMEDISDMFESSLDRGLVEQGIHDVSTVTEEEVMGEDEPPIGEEPMADLFEVSEEDVMGGGVDDLTEGGEPDDLSDLVDVDESDIIGEPVSRPEMQTEMPQRRVIRKFKRTSRPYYPPPSSLGGIRS